MMTGMSVLALSMAKPSLLAAGEQADPGRPRFTGASVLCLLAIALVLLLLYMLARGWRGRNQRNR
jgi:hypothetical protein